MFKVLAVLWIPLSIVVTAFALAAGYESQNPGAVAWTPFFKSILDQYQSLSAAALVPLTEALGGQLGFTVPPIAGQAVIAYTASASGAAFAGSNFTSREGQLHAFRSSAMSLSFPIAIVTFVVNSLRNGTIRRFATEHTAWFVAYGASVAGVIAFGIYGLAWLGLGA